MDIIFTIYLLVLPYDEKTWEKLFENGLVSINDFTVNFALWLFQQRKLFYRITIKGKILKQYNDNIIILNSLYSMVPIRLTIIDSRFLLQ